MPRRYTNTFDLVLPRTKLDQILHNVNSLLMTIPLSFSLYLTFGNFSAVQTHTSLLRSEHVYFIHILFMRSFPFGLDSVVLSDRISTA